MGHVKLGSTGQPWWLRALLTGYKWAASLQAAVLLITLTAAVLGWATFVEKWHGTEAVSFGIYRAWWFMVLVALLGLNVLCATLIRWPWKKHQTGFVITHTGILVLLAGCLLQQGWGIQGQMILHEGEASNVVYEDQKVFRLEIFEGESIDQQSVAGHPLGQRPGSKTVEVPFRSGPFHWADYQRLPFFPWRIVPRDQGRIYDKDGITLEVLDYYADSERLVVPRLVLGLMRVGRAEQEVESVLPAEGRLTLTVAPARGPHAAERPFGVGDRQQMPWGPPVVFWLAGSPAECQAFLSTGPEGPVGSLGQVVLWHQGRVYRFSLQQLQNQPDQPLGDSGLTVRLVEYMEQMRAVQLEITGSARAGSSRPVQMFLFAQNPSHNRQAEAVGVYGSFWVEPPPVPERLAGIQRVELLRLAACLRLDILQGPDGLLYYRQWHAPRVVSAGLWPGMSRQGIFPANRSASAGPPPPKEAKASPQPPPTPLAPTSTQDSPWGQPYPVERLEQLRVFAGTALETEIRLVEFRPSPQPAILYEPKPLEGRPSAGLRQPRAKVRLTVRETSGSGQGKGPSSRFGSDDSAKGLAAEPAANTGEFWIPLGGPRFADEQATVSCGDRRVSVQLDYRKWHLGMRIYLRDFTRKVDPGSGHDAHYSSLVDVLEGADPPTVRQEKVLITMNQPLTAKDPISGRTYRFYQSSFAYLGKPGDPEYEQWLQQRAFHSSLDGQPSADQPASQSNTPTDSFSGATGPNPIPEHLYRSILSVNYDPGRGLKYAGSFLIILGIAVMYLMRAYIFAPRSSRSMAAIKSLTGLMAIGGVDLVGRLILELFLKGLTGLMAMGLGLLAAAWLMLGDSGPARADQLDWSAWRRLPVFAGGRVMPMDSFSRSVVEQICGRANPRLGLAEALPGEDLNRPEYTEARKLFPDGKARTWPHYELIFSWLVEPQRWQRAPFLVGQHHQLREDLLGLPREDASGRPIRYVSPWQLEHAEGFWRWQAELRRRQQEAEAAGQKFQPTGLDRKAWQLLEAYTAWRELVFSAEAVALPQSLFHTRLAELHQLWQATAEAMEQALEMAEAHAQAQAADQSNHSLPAQQSGSSKLLPEAASPQQEQVRMGTGARQRSPQQAYRRFQEAIQTLRALAEQRPIDRPQMEPPARQLRESAQELADWFEQFYQRLRQSPPPMLSAHWQQMQAHWMALVSRCRDLHRLAWEVQTALFDNSPVVGARGEMLRLVPSLNPFALEETRTPEENPQPWLTWQALMEASLTATLAEYPIEEIQAVRKAFQQAAQAYQDRQSADRPARFAAAMQQLADALHQLGQAINQQRAQLPVRKLDQAAFQATQYPPPGATDLEVHYNQLDPFRAAWIGYLLAVLGFALAFGRIRTSMFWLGMVVSAVAQFFILYGLALRYAITGWVPVTNMFETVVFVALTVGLMGWLLAVWPMLGPGLKLAWQLTAWPIPMGRLSKDGGESGPTSHPPASPRASSWPDASASSAASLPGRNQIGLSDTKPASLTSQEQPPVLSVRAVQLWRWLWAPVRLALMGVVFYGLTQVHYGEAAGYTVVSLWPRLERGGSLTANDLAAWLVGWAFLLLSMWYAPRAVLAAAGTLWTTPVVWRRQGVRQAYQQVLGRKAYAFAGAVMGLLGALLAYYAPPTVLDKSIGPLRPVLRDNFWLTAHVLTITASYGAGALALALGNLALFHYLFGRYRPATVGEPVGGEQQPAQTPPEGSKSSPSESRSSASASAEVSAVPPPEGAGSALESAKPGGLGAPEELASAAEGIHIPGGQTGRFRREPAACATLAQYIYRSMQAAVLLLAAGTILGALWADVAWGRFWGWDAKEVWALISLLVYMVVLHGRYIGWFGNFGMAAFSVIGATSILMAWYGVNYVLDVGLHTYGRGTGGLGVVLAAVAANWLFLAAAAVRYYLQTRSSPAIPPK